MDEASATQREDVDLGATKSAPRQGVTRTMLFLASWIALSTWISNFDNGYAGTVLIMPAYKKAFGHCGNLPDPTTGKLVYQCELTADQQSLISVSSLFMGIGAVLSGVTGHYIGRRGTIAFGCALTVIGAAGMLGTAGSYVNYMVCRCIGAVGLGQSLAATSIYGTECMAAHKRGFLLNLYNVGLAMGNVASTAVCAGSAHLPPDDNWQWQTPIICQIPLGVILGVGIFMFPESPRWLIVKGREQAARKSFGRLYGKDGSSAEITAQVEEVLRYVELEKERSANTSWTDIFRHGDLRRTLVSALVLISLALSGIQFVAPYAALFLSGVGITNPYVINVIFGCCILAGSTIGGWTVEYGGRRFCLLVGYGIMAVCMLLVGAVGSGLGSMNPTAQNVMIAFLCIWAFTFGGFTGPTVWLASAEMHSVRLRTYGQANSALLYEIFAFGATFWTPYMLSAEYGNMGTRVGYFYFGVLVALFILVFLFVPETARLTLEQIDDYFASGRKPWNTSLGRNKLLARDANTATAGAIEYKMASETEYMSMEK